MGRDAGRQRPAGPTRLGLVNPETWAFLHDLFASLSARYATSVFAPTETRSPVFRERLTRWRLARDLSAFMARHDVVFFEWASELLAQATRLPKRCAIVTRLHRYELYTWADRINWDAVDRIILVSEARRRAFIRRYPEQAAKTVVVPVGVPAARFATKTAARTGALGTLCHLTPRKRVYDLVLAFADMAKRAPSLHLYIGGGAVAGFEDYDEAIRSLVGRLGLEQRVTFDGPVAEPWTWYPKIDVFVSHSYSEGLQVAPMEAMAAGCYTLCHHWDGADELVPPGSLYVGNDELVQKVEAYCRLSDAERAAEREHLRLHAAEHFDLERLNARVSQIIDDCVAGPRPHGVLEREPQGKGL